MRKGGFETPLRFCKLLCVDWLGMVDLVPLPYHCHSGFEGKVIHNWIMIVFPPDCLPKLHELLPPDHFLE